jgi:hypothetical protein
VAQDAEESPLVNHWLDTFDQTIRAVEIRDPREEEAFAHWLAQSAIRQEGRRGRMLEASPFVPSIVWIVLGVAGLFLIGYKLLYADPGERLFVQAFTVAAIVSMVVAGLFLVRFLDRPYHDHGGAIHPTLMRQAIAYMEGSAVAICDDQGNPT